MFLSNNNNIIFKLTHVSVSLMISDLEIVATEHLKFNLLVEIMCHSHHFYEEHLLIRLFNMTISEFQEIMADRHRIYHHVTFYVMNNILHMFAASGCYSKYFNFPRKV